jgi:hypothetical protein
MLHSKPTVVIQRTTGSVHDICFVVRTQPVSASPRYQVTFRCNQLTCDRQKQNLRRRPLPVLEVTVSQSIETTVWFFVVENAS